MNRPTSRHLAAGFLLGLLVIFLPAGSLQAAAINSNVALPVREGGFVYRTQLRYVSTSDDPTPMDRDIEAFIVPNVLVYGATARTT